MLRVELPAAGIVGRCGARRGRAQKGAAVGPQRRREGGRHRITGDAARDEVHRDGKLVEGEPPISIEVSQLPDLAEVGVLQTCRNGARARKEEKRTRVSERCKKEGPVARQRQSCGQMK